MARVSIHGGVDPAGTAARQTFIVWLGRWATEAFISAARLVTDAVGELSRRHRQNLAIRQLSKMPDRQLKDIGLSRADIVVAVRTGPQRRPGVNV